MASTSEERAIRGQGHGAAGVEHADCGSGPVVLLLRKRRRSRHGAAVLGERNFRQKTEEDMEAACDRVYHQN
jgi:hypothetical protein